jgi:NAD dependent epimerase/dehydratase family enzyme
MSWIHKDDLINIILYAIENTNIEGIVNVTAPHPLIAKEFFKHIGKEMNRPSWFPVPGGILKLLLGEMAEEVLLSSQKVIPQNLLHSGYRFHYPEIDAALKNLF